MSAHTKRRHALTKEERAKKYGPKYRTRGPFLHPAVLPVRSRSVTLHPFAGRHREARVEKFKGAQRAKKAVAKSRREMRAAGQRRGQ